MRTEIHYTIRYRLNGEWRYSNWKMSVEYAEKQYDVTQWEPVPESREEVQIDDSWWNLANSTSAFLRNTGHRPYANPKRPPILNWPFPPDERE
jgi:hypothetical protein